MLQYIWLIPIGFALGAYGTMIGAGGGFLLVPLLLFLYPDETPEIITSISLAVVFFNALSGSVAYARQKRIDYASGVIFSLATVPGAVLGAVSTSLLSRRLFDGIFGVIMITATIFLIIKPSKKPYLEKKEPVQRFSRLIIEANGTQHRFSYNVAQGIGISLLVGYLSSLLGVGGGFIHVPALVHLLNFPVHIATATSHFILAAMSLTGTAVHIVTGTFTRGIRRTIVLAIGVLIGAQVGAYFSDRLHGDLIIRGLAAALGFVGLRLLWHAFFST
jgi:uncharacterized membrane protein YfcA